MSDDVELLRRVYALFNSRDIESVLAAMHPDVVWANGMEGGHVHGRDEVRSYWKRQWAMIDPHVEPTAAPPAFLLFSRPRRTPAHLWRITNRWHAGGINVGNLN
jgi:SnoaL-like domain